MTEDSRPRERHRIVRPIAVHDVDLFAEQCLDVTAPAQHAQDQDVVTVNAIRDHVVTDRATAHIRSQVFVATTADVGLASEDCESAVIEPITRSAMSMLLLWVARKYQISSRSDSACGATRKDISATHCVPQPVACAHAA
jgi:hypothetical protein